MAVSPARRITSRLPRRARLLALVLFALAAQLAQAQAPVTAKVEVIPPAAPDQVKSSAPVADGSNVVVWLTPLDRAFQPLATPAPPGSTPQIVQRNKSFQPHILVVEVGTVVQFPNQDPFFHNIFSLFDGKRFDLGLYESGSSRTVRFDRPGVSFLFCNIHPGMSAVIVVVDSPYFGMSDRSGRVVIPGVPSGSYETHVWYERGLPENLKSLDQRVVISESTRSLGAIRVLENTSFAVTHKNKYGQDYVPPPRPNYVHP